MMNNDQLRAALTPDGGITTIAVGSLTASVDALLRAAYGGQALTITQATLGPGDGADGAVVIAGQAPLLGVQDAAVELRATVDGQGDVQLVARFACPVAPTGTWRFSTSFPDLPTLPDWSQPELGGESVPLDDLTLTEAAFVLSTGPGTDPVTGATLTSGITFAGRVRLDGVVALARTLFGFGGDTVVLSGPVVLPGPTATFLPVPSGRFPWEAPGTLPGLWLSADLGLDQAVGPMSFGGIGFTVYSPPSNAWLAANPTYRPVQAFTGTLSIPSASISADVIAPTYGGATALLMLARVHGMSVANLASLADAVGHDDLGAMLPPGATSGSGGLGDLQLVSLGLELSVAQESFGVTWAAVSVGMPDVDWRVWDPHLAVDSVVAQFEVTDPFNNPVVDVTVFGTVEVEGVPVDILATSAGGFRVEARLAEAQTIPLRQLLADYAPGVAPPTDLTIDQLAVSVEPGRSYGMALALAEQPHPWVIPLGPSSLTISDVTAAVTYPAGGPATGTFGGTVGFGEVATLSLSVGVPGPFVLRGAFPQVRLSEIVGTLTDQALELPAGFDVEFDETYAMITAAGGTSVFQAATQIAGFGACAIQVQRVGGTWGIAAGFDLAAGSPVGLGGLGGLAPLLELVALDRFLLVVSSFDAPGFAFPDMAAFNQPQLPTKNVSLPAQAGGGIAAGLNLFAEWTIDTSSRQEMLLTRLLGVEPVIGVTLQVGTDPARDAMLSASYSSTIAGMPLRCTFGGVIRGGELGVFLQGTVDATIQGSPQRFDVVLLFVENGAFLSGSMQGPTALDFGSFKLSNLALEIGVDWEGIPSLGVAATIDTSRFEASVAVFFDSADPAKSLVAGSMSSLTLADVVAVFAGLDAPTPLDDVLSQIALTATDTFMVPAAVGDALDALDMATVSAAFAAAGVTIPASSRQVLLNDPDHHPSVDEGVKAAGRRWYLTDMSRMIHYELERTDAGISVALSPQLYCAPMATTIGAIPFPAGFRVSGGLDIFGWKAELRAEVSTAVGIAIDGAMDPIVIGDGSVFRVTGAGGQGGPRVSLSTFAQPGNPVLEYQSPHFFASGEIAFLGLTRDSFSVEVTSTGFAFDLVGTLFPLVIFDVHGHFDGPDSFGAGGGITLGFQNVTFDLGLTTVTLDTSAQGTLDVSYDGQDVTATFGFSFTFQGETLQVSEFALDVHTGPLSDLWATVHDKILDRLLHADITLHVDNMVQGHLDSPGSEHIDNVGAPHIDSATSPPHWDIKKWNGEHGDTPAGHNDIASAPHQDQAGAPHNDHAEQHQDQYYHVDQGVETTVKPPQV